MRVPVCAVLLALTIAHALFADKERDPVLSNGQMKVRLNSSSGAFSLYALGGDGAEVPVLFGSDGGTSSFLAVQVARRQYRLNSGNAVSISTERTDSGIAALYSVKNVFSADVSFDFVPPYIQGQQPSVVRMAVSVTNASPSPAEFALKSVFDTVLGEGSDIHFVSASGTPVSGGTMFTNLTDEQWVMSRSAKAAVQFIFSGHEATVPLRVVAGTKDRLSGSRWLPAADEQAGFNSVLSYNNSVLSVNWSGEVLQPGQTMRLVLYIGVSYGAAAPPAQSFLSARLAPVVPVPEARPAPEPQALPDVEFIVPQVQDYQLSDEYIQNLLARIAALESDSGQVDRDEIRRLNAELDAILEKLRRMER